MKNELVLSTEWSLIVAQMSHISPAYPSPLLQQLGMYPATNSHPIAVHSNPHGSTLPHPTYRLQSDIWTFCESLRHILKMETQVNEWKKHTRMRIMMQVKP